MTSSGAWRYVDADDELAADFLAGTVEAVQETGGWIHPSTRLVVRDGQAHIECDAPEGDPLLVVGRDAFVRVGRVGWGDSQVSLEFDGIPDELSPIEAQLLILQTAFHNACGKLPWLVATHPVLADLDERLVAAVRAFRPSFRRRRPTAASLFWSDRVFRLPVGVDGAIEPVAVPLVDLLDHDHRGSTGSWTGDSFSVTLSRPRGSSEARLDYGLERDAIGMAVVYGFAVEDSAIAHSAPLEVEVTGVGRVRVEARGRGADGSLRAPMMRHAEGTTVLSHLSFRPGEEPADIDPRIVSAVAGENLHLLDALRDAAMETAAPAAATLAAAAAVQATVIRASLPNVA